MKLHVWGTKKGLQVEGFRAGSMEDFRIFWKELQNQFMGLTIDFCYKDCPVPVDYMSEINAKVLESCTKTTLSQDDFIPANDYELTLVTRENFEGFAQLHDNACPESSGMYWTSERVYEDFDNWVMYMYGSNYILMRLGRSDEAEVYALKTADKDIGANLVSGASEYAFKAGKTSILQMVEDEEEAELEIVKSVGFLTCGKYIAYRSVVK